ncbi:MAG: hypothetical protein FRX49_10032 [Trebouxia sp. A1-2]|nr:MAG: hypothetical protein FRX49_10032 [Trebouxia sp. A1-2]
MLLGSRSSVSSPSGGPVAMKTVLGFKYLIFKLLFPRICMRGRGVVVGCRGITFSEQRAGLQIHTTRAGRGGEERGGEGRGRSLISFLSIKAYLRDREAECSRAKLLAIVRVHNTVGAG